MIDKIKKKLSNLTENDKIVYKNIIGAFVVKGGALVISLFTMPTYIKFFNDDVVLGLWFTVLSMLNWMLNFDLGIGNGLRNHLTKALIKKDDVEAKKYISSAYTSIGGIALVVTVIGIFVIKFVNWNVVFNIEESTVSSSALRLAVGITFVGIMVHLVLKLISSILYAMQKSSINNFISLSTTILTLIAVMVIPSFDNDRNMIIMAIVHALAVAIPLVIATIIVFAQKSMRAVSPSVKFFAKPYAKRVLSLGGVFFSLQIMYMILTNTNEFLITSFTGNQYVVEYQIYYKLATLAGTMFALILTPIWSAVTKAIAENNFEWVRSLYKKLLALSGIATICEFALIPFLQIVINLWLGEEAIEVHYGYALVFALNGSIMILISVISSIANGIGKLKTQMICYIIGSIIKIPLAWLFVQITHSWIGVVMASVISLAIYCIAQPINFRTFFKRIK